MPRSIINEKRVYGWFKQLLRLPEYQEVTRKAIGTALKVGEKKLRAEFSTISPTYEPFDGLKKQQKTEVQQKIFLALVRLREDTAADQNSTTKRFNFKIIAEDLRPLCSCSQSFVSKLTTWAEEKYMEEEQVSLVNSRRKIRTDKGKKRAGYVKKPGESSELGEDDGDSVVGKGLELASSGTELKGSGTDLEEDGEMDNGVELVLTEEELIDGEDDMMYDLE